MSGEWIIRVPGLRRSPFVALHVSSHGYDVYRGRSRHRTWVQLTWGVQFTGLGRSHVTIIPWRWRTAAKDSTRGAGSG